MRTLAEGIAFGECPRWHDGRLWVTDWAAQELLAFGLDGEREVVARVPSFPFSVDWLPDGTPLVLSSAANALLRLEDGELASHIDLAALSEHPWNELVIDGRGNAYVNNLGFDFPGGEFAPGSVVVVTLDGVAARVGEGLAFPNGMAITPDDSTLIVAESYAARLTAFDIEPGGSLANRRTWADLGEGAAPDGICLDAEGAVWYGDVPNRRCVRVAEGGDVLDTIDLDRGCFACMLGGEDGRTLFLVTREWQGLAGGGGAEEARTGQVLMAEAPAPRAGRP